jgi:hypothetical protein
MAKNKFSKPCINKRLTSIADRIMVSIIILTVFFLFQCAPVPGKDYPYPVNDKPESENLIRDESGDNKLSILSNMVEVKWGRTKVNGVNLRSGPGTNYSVVGKVDRDMPLVLECKVGDWWVVDDPSYPLLQHFRDEDSAYIYASLIDSEICSFMNAKDEFIALLANHNRQIIQYTNISKFDYLGVDGTNIRVTIDNGWDKLSLVAQQAEVTLLWGEWRSCLLRHGERDEIACFYVYRKTENDFIMKVCGEYNNGDWLMVIN